MSTMSNTKLYPNIIICGTPGVGKSRLCQELCAKNSALTYININELAKREKFLLEHDDENECDILDDDAIEDYLNREYFDKSTRPSGLVIDYHSAGIVPASDDIHGVFVLRCSNEILYDRLEKRHYSKEKIDQNIQSEIFQVCLDEARESFDEKLVHECTNESEEDFQKNLDNLQTWMEQWPISEPKKKKKKKN